MKPFVKKELPALAVILLPFIYLTYIWNDLPARIPMHWNIHGEIDRYGNKAELILVALLMPVLIYLLLLAVPLIDPKNKISNMGNKYRNLRTLVTLFMSVLSMYIIYSVKAGSLFNPNYILLILGIFYAVLGNYMKTIKANYFVGIRTPWTLESETVWKDTHRMGGWMWFAGGLIIIAGSLILEPRAAFVFFLIITGIIAFVPVVYSYLLFKKQQNIKNP